MTQKRPPAHGPIFEAMMADIDAKLTTDGVDIPSRPLMAVREVSMKYGLSIPIGDSARIPLDLRDNLELGNSINEWYTHNYGDRLKVNPCPGRAVALLDGDLYVLRVPRMFGQVNFVLTRDWQRHPGISRGPAICNIVQLVTGMTPAKAARLSDDALNELSVVFQAATAAAYTLESTDHRLMSIARGDIEVAVAGLMAHGERFGESKWASLQATEKVLKAAIDLSGHKFKFTHGLAELCTTLIDSGISFDASAQIAAIQCKPSIRYGEETCSRNEALIAHQASFEMINILRHAGAKFNCGIGEWVRSSV